MFFPANFRAPRGRTKLKSVTMHGFGGGWDAVDEDLTMSARYCKSLINFKRTPSGAQKVRFGTQWKADIKDVVSGDIVDMEYFNSRIICVTALGEVAAIDSDFNVTAIWNATIASALPGVPSGWSTGLTSIDFVPFKNTLVIHNGVDKPISIDQSFDVTYLQDLATGSNVNVPIGKYGCVAGNFHVIAGVEDEPTTLYISSTGTAGTWIGDPSSDATSIDVGAYAPDSGDLIRGIEGFRNRLIVFFAQQCVIITLGIYDDSDNHIPAFDDALPVDYGLLGHRATLKVGQDLLFADRNGLNSAKRNLFVASSIEGTHLSAIVAPAYQNTMAEHTDAEILANSWMIHDHLGNDIIIFCPDGCTFVYSFSEELRYKSWSKFQGWSWTCGCQSALGRVFFATGSKVFQLGNTAYGELYYADRLNDRDGTWDNSITYTEGDLILDSDTDTVYECQADHTSASIGTFAADRTANPDNWSEWLGVPIDFVLEPPWQDGRDIMRTKHMRFLNVLSKGTAPFTVSIYVDNKFKDDEDNIIHSPALSLDMVGNEAGGFGYDDNDDQNYGGGRRSGDPRLWDYPVKFKMAKFYISGSVRNPLTIAGIAFLYSIGAFKR